MIKYITTVNIASFFFFFLPVRQTVFWFFLSPFPLILVEIIT